MPRTFIAVISMAAAAAIAATVAAPPALAKGATQASITGPGLARPVTVAAPGQGESLPGQGDALSSLAGQSGLFLVLFGLGDGISDQPSPLAAAPAAASLGPRYTLTYTVPGVTPAAGQADGKVRQALYPRAAGGPVIYTPPGQQGFGQPLLATGWLRGTRQLTATLTRLGVPAGPSLSSAPGGAAPAGPASAAPATSPGATPAPAGATAPAGLIAAAASAAALVVAGTAMWLRRRSRPLGGTDDGAGLRQGTGDRRVP